MSAADKLPAEELLSLSKSKSTLDSSEARRLWCFFQRFFENLFFSLDKSPVCEAVVREFPGEGGRL